MSKITTLLILSLLLVNVQCGFAKQKDTLAQPSNTTSAYEIDENFTFDENSYNVSDEQLQETEDINKIEEKTSFLSRIINSSHFSSDTATRTWIPINRVK